MFIKISNNFLIKVANTNNFLLFFSSKKCIKCIFVICRFLLFPWPRYNYLLLLIIIIVVNTFIIMFSRCIFRIWRIFSLKNSRKGNVVFKDVIKSILYYLKTFFLRTSTGKVNFIVKEKLTFFIGLEVKC